MGETRPSLFKRFGPAVRVVAWLATVFPTPWIAIMSAVGSTAVTMWAVSGAWLNRPIVHTAILLFMVFLWSYIGLALLATRNRPMEIFPKKDFRYGLTFENAGVNFWPNYEDAALQIIINFRNYLPTPLKYQVEHFEGSIETRSISAENIGPFFMTRGAGRSVHLQPFKADHIREFYGKRPEGKFSVSIVYGDVDGEPTRRLKMTFKTFFSFPAAQESLWPNTLGVPLGFNATILKESDEPIGS